MAIIKVPKKEYEKLIEKAFRYEFIRQVVEEDFFASPPTRSVQKVIGEFKKTGKYNQKFLGDLRKGLKRSSYFKV